MELHEILKQIRPCSMNHEYIFISYSSIDRDLVWRDVLEFQRRGYNVWLDEKNLDKTKSSWKSDALEAIRDMDCALLIFYVSRNSLISEACYRELSETTDSYTSAVHFGPVKFIAVDVEDIGDITIFSKKVYELLRSSSLPKPEKTARALVLNHFVTQFFNSNNEKVRIHPKHELGRKMDYYEEITASFPDATRFLPASSPEPVPETSETDNGQTSPVSVPDTERRAAAILPAAEADQVSAPSLPLRKIDKLADPAISAEEEHRIPESKSRTEEAALRSRLLSLFAQYARSKAQAASADRFSVVLIKKAMSYASGQHPETAFHFRPFLELSEKQIQNAICSYAPSVSPDQIAGLMDTTLFGTGKKGILVTASRLYSTYLNSGEFLELNELIKVSSAPRENHLILWMNDGTLKDLYFSIYTPQIKDFLDYLLTLPKTEPQ